MPFSPNSHRRPLITLAGRIGLLSAVTIGLSAILSFLLFSGAMVVGSPSTLERMSVLADRVAANVEILPKRPALRLPADLTLELHSRTSTVRYALMDGEGRFRAGSPGIAAPLDPGALGVADNTVSERAIPGNDDEDESTRIIATFRRRDIGGRPITLQFEARKPDPGGVVPWATEAIEMASRGPWSWIAGVTAFIAIINGFAIRLWLRPLRRASQAAELIGPESLDRRIEERGVPSEILPLVRAVNGALDRVEAGVARERGFIADASHELRTPLAVLKAGLDRLPESNDVAAVRADADRLTRIVHQLLRLAEVEGRPHDSTGGMADLMAVAAEVAADLFPGALDTGKMLAVHGDLKGEERVERLCAGDPVLVRLVVRNIVENALRHAHADVTMTVSGCEIVVDDDGPGVPPEYRDAIFQRFWRADRQDGGAGLGLAIVKRVLDRIGGTVRVEEAPSGGARFRIEFALALETSKDA